MELEARVADLERRLAALEGAHRAGPRLDESDFWALNGLKEQLAELGADDGGVLYTGSVRLPTGEPYAWQMGALTEGLLEGDWTAAAESFAALGHPVRLRLLREILGGRRTAAELAELDEVGTTGQIYHHLRQLTGTGWLHTTGRGRYEVPAQRVVPLLVAVATARP
ncbi:ArsR/SmtB family transcription factor [Streptomyces purpurascens]|uniref:Helix-turn-helix domain-containing protein n=1 Tax=Streptomyces purpurascens TaxID=1924 RepID=A0ABZ1MK17_STREF|nr:helix-turn-helix domain-containing protein [Streptomyces purpurascens]MCE7046776.1 helix-turn-helix domain-containing protein [Streptomyces purpurascens]GHA43145.1 transcriptional regulator [Streptomyces purpurascens]